MPSLPHDVDLLDWFSEDEREVCERCGKRSAVSVPDALASFCLRCGAIAIDGVAVDGLLPIASSRL
jgi:hypothetical protein